MGLEKGIFKPFACISLFGYFGGYSEKSPLPQISQQLSWSHWWL